MTKPVYRVDITAGFFILANNRQEAVRIARELCPEEKLAQVAPWLEQPSINVYQTIEGMRDRCVNQDQQELAL